MGTYFFLYGVYSEGQPCFGRFKNFIKSSQAGMVKASVFQLLSGLYLIAEGGDNVIRGQLVELDIPESSWATFDAINGCFSELQDKAMIHRVSLNVLTANESVNAQSYVLNPAKKDQFRAVILADEVRPSLFDKLSERHKTYISKLAKAKGREIVPVDMALYRELMALELIVDKGRRLALTPLGHEVSYFL